MAKAMLIMDMPSKCVECPCIFEEYPYAKCDVLNKKIEDENKYGNKPKWCPLREVPKKKIKSKADSTSLISIGEIKGYNACIDEILGGGE